MNYNINTDTTAPCKVLVMARLYKYYNRYIPKDILFIMVNGNHFEKNFILLKNQD